MNDVRFALRQLARSPGFTVVAVLTLGLGIGACGAIFSVVNGVLLRPPPYAEPERLVVVHETARGGGQELPVSGGRHDDLLTQARSFQSIGSYNGGSYVMTGTGAAVHVRAQRLSPSVLPTLRVTPLLGRNFLPEEVPEQIDGQRVAILSYGLWQRQFGGRPDVLNQTIRLNDRPATVVGVMPRVSPLPGQVDVFTPLLITPPQRRSYGGRSLSVIARLQPGVTLAEAQSEMAVIVERTTKTNPDSQGWSVKLVPMLENTVGEVKPVLLALLGAVAFLLLIACANIANLLLARATVRGKEIAVRAALGAGRARIVRQLLTESLLLAFLGGALGVLVAHLGLAALLTLAPENLPRATEIAVDGRVLGFTLALALLTGLGFGLVPALQASQVQLHDTLKQAGRGASDGKNRRWLRGALVAGELATALMLLAGAGLLVRSFLQLYAVNPGFNPQDAVVAGVFRPRPAYGSPGASASYVDFARRVVDEIAVLPGVQAVAATTGTPLSNVAQSQAFGIAGRPWDASAEMPVASIYNVGPDYFRAMGIPLSRGRRFQAQDTADSLPVVIVNEFIARSLFSGRDPIGQRISIGGARRFREIVGIAGDVKGRTLDGELGPQVYLPFAQGATRTMAFVVRGATSSAAFPGALRAALSRVDPDQPITNIRPLTTLVDESLARERFAVTLFTVFSVVALLLAALGIYGVMAYAVGQRTGEFGLRMALGAQSGDVLRLVLVQGGRLVALGVLAGLVGALLLTRLLEKLLFNVKSYDPLTFAGIVGLLALVAGAACLLPARRASRVNPMTALRTD